MSKLSNFTDVKAVLDAAMRGGKYTLPTAGMAKHWRQRAYHLRSLQREAYGSSPYDKLILRIEPDAPCVVLILPQSATGILTDLDDRPLITPEGQADPLLEEVHDLVGKLSIDV